jgi:glycerol uptake facilitator protein
VGAVFASFILYALINKDLQAFEHAQALVRGEVNSYHSAVMFGEFFPNPGYESSLQVSPLKAGVAEGFGTFVLVLGIFILSAKDWCFHKWVPVLIGLLVGGIILCVAPYTQAGINPARDFGPRLVAYFSGWGEVAFPAVRWSFFTVYIASPMVGGATAAFLFKRIMSIR